MASSILPRVAAGEPQAIDDCIRVYGGLVWSIARRFLADAAEVEDAVQEVYIALWQSASRFDPDKAAEATFVTMIARRKLIDRLRRAGARPSVAQEAEEDRPEQADPVSGSARLEAGVELRRAAEALDTLRPAERRVVELAVVQGMSHSEIANETGLPLGTVKTNVRRGLGKVRELLASGRGGGR